LKQAGRDLLWAVIICACVVGVLGLLSSLPEPKPLKTTHIPSLAERVSVGLCGGAFSGAALGAVAGIDLALLRLVKGLFAIS
jgi:hypothetical protein